MFNCIFCQSTLSTIQSDYFSYIQEDCNIFIFFCNHCYADFITFKNLSLASSSLYTVINNHTYKWSQPPNLSKKLWIIPNGQIPCFPVKPHPSLLIKQFSPSSPNLSPHNINKKIKTLLAFL